MAGHENRVVNAAFWTQQRIAAMNEGKLWDATNYAERQAAFHATPVAERQQMLVPPPPPTPPPDFFRDFLPHVKIRGDGKYRGPIPFTPYGYQTEVFEALLAGESIVWLKERQIGASWCLSTWAYFVSAYHEGHDSALISMGQRESDALLAKVAYVHDRLPPDLFRETVGWRQMKFAASGSTVYAFPSTRTAGISFTFSFIAQDEAARHGYAAENYAEYGPTIASGGQIAICSTSDPELGASGFFYEMVQETLGGQNDYKFIFSGRYSRPSHNDAFYERERRVQRLDEHKFNSHYPATIEDAFMGKTGMVYDQWNPLLHVRQDDPMAWEEYDYRICGIDPGGGDPTAIVVLGVWQDKTSGTLRFHQPQGGEFYKRGPVAQEEMVNWLAAWPNLTRIYDGSSGGSTLLAGLRHYYGNRVWPADRDRQGIGTIASLLDSQHLTIHASNTESINEFNGYRWVDRVDPHDKLRYRTNTPVDNHADAMDARRYAVCSFIKKVEQMVAGGGLTPRDRLLANGTTAVRREVPINWS